MRDILKIGEYEFVTAPGQVLRRKTAGSGLNSWIFILANLTVAAFNFHDHKYGLALVFAVIGLGRIVDTLSNRRETKPLMKVAGGRLVVRNQDAGPVDSVAVTTKQEGKRYLVLLEWPHRKAKPYLVWWAWRRSEAEGLRDLIVAVLPAGRDEDLVWPPAPRFNDPG
jgi:hypothetical protein